MKEQRRMIVWLLPVAAVLVMVLMWGAPHWWPNHTEDRPECPHTVTDFDISNTNHLLIPGPIANIPEYHDCQRFLVKNANGELKYDSMEAIFVRYKIDTIYRSFGRGLDLRNRQGAVPVASEFIANGFQVVGQVLSYGDYAPLGITSGSDCLVLQWKTRDNVTTYEAWMVGVGRDGDRCKNDAPSLLVRDRNQVKLEVALVNTVGEVPPVSRWDWDRSDSLQYIGIACPTGWCEIHAPGPFQSSPTYGGPNDPITKGSYDEQYLATNVSGHITHDGITFGTVYPDPRLAQQTMASYRSWQPVAWVALRTTSHAYRDKLNFDPAPPPSVSLRELTDRTIASHLNMVELCFVPTGQVGCVAVGAPPLPTTCTTDITNNGIWYARVRPPKVREERPGSLARSSGPIPRPGAARRSLALAEG